MTDASAKTRRPAWFTALIGVAFSILGIFVLAAGYWVYWITTAFDSDRLVTDVNEAADWLIETGDTVDLEAAAKRIRDEVGKRGRSKALVHDADVVAMVPRKYWPLGRGREPKPPRDIMVTPEYVGLQWPRFANAYHEVRVYHGKPPELPTGHFGRIVNDRVFVLAYHSSNIPRVPVGNAREPSGEQ